MGIECGDGRRGERCGIEERWEKGRNNEKEEGKERIEGTENRKVKERMSQRVSENEVKESVAR